MQQNFCCMPRSFSAAKPYFFFQQFEQPKFPTIVYTLKCSRINPVVRIKTLQLAKNFKKEN